MNAGLRSRLLRDAQRPGGVAATLLRRASVQLEFARAFVELDPRHEEWRELVADAEARFNDATDLQSAVGEMEAALAPLGREAKGYTVHLVGHGHIDMNWMWSWPETVAATHDTFASALAFMRRDPDVTYTQSQASVYALMERFHPSLFEEIKARVKEGRWEVTATQWVEGDKNLVHGESLARHLLYARRACADWFGMEPEDAPVAWEPDTFGHANTIPSILAAGGVKYYYSCRPGGGHGHPRLGPERPPLFWWEGPDGARLLVNRETTWYNSYVNIGENFALPLVRFAKRTGVKRWLNVFGIGNHGGGPTATELAYLRETMEWPIYPTVEFGTAKSYFEAIEGALPEDLPVLAQELNYEFTGCYTSQSAIKRAHRLGESGALDAEAANAVARAIGVGTATGPNPREAWIPVLFSQFHDILTGSGVEATRMHALGTLHEGAAIAGAAVRRLASALASRVDTMSLLPAGGEGDEERVLAETGFNVPFQAGAGVGAGETGFSPSTGGGVRHRPYVVWNPLAWTRSAAIEIHLWDLDLDASRIVATDETGRSLPTLVTYAGSSPDVDWGHRRTTVVFTAEDVPGLGYRTYLLHEGEPSADAPTVGVADGERFDAGGLKLRVDRYGLGIEMESESGSGTALAGWSATNERDRGMSAWVIGNETRVGGLQADTFHLHGAQIDPGSGTYGGRSAAYLAVRKARVPDSQTTVTLKTLVPPLGRRIEFDAEIAARDVGTPLGGMPGLTVDVLPGPEDSAVFETPHGSVSRENQGHEVPTFRFTHLPHAGITVLQDGRGGFKMEPDGVRMRAIRASFEPDPTPEVGTRRVRYALVFHETPPTRTDLARLGAEFNHPLVAFPATLQTGDLPTVRGFLEVEGALPASLKIAESQDGRVGGLVLRLVAYDGGVQASARFDPALLPAGASVRALDLVERPIAGDAAASMDGSILRATVPATGFVSLGLAPT